MSLSVACVQKSMMTFSPSLFTPFGAWITHWMSRMTNKNRVRFGRPISLASRVTWLVSAAMIAVFLIFNWISIRSLEQHFAEMDEEELEVIASSVIWALDEGYDGSDAHALQRAVRCHYGVYYFVANSSGDVLFEPEGGHDLARFAATDPPIELEIG